MGDPAERRRTVLTHAGFDPDQPMVAVPSNANEAWIGAEIAVRINHPGLVGAQPGRLLREARIVERLAPAACYPEILAVGSDQGLAWLITRRVPGVQLGRAWRTMSASDRERAIHQLAAALDALHATPIEGLLSSPGDDIEPPHTLPLEPLLALIETAVEDPVLRRDLATFVRARWAAFEDAQQVLVHGDPHLENVLWDGVKVALLDLEWARASWRECDLEILLAIAEHPALFAAKDYEATVDAADYIELPRYLAAARPEWFADARTLDRLDVLFVSRTLGLLAEAPQNLLRIEHLQARIAEHT